MQRKGNEIFTGVLFAILWASASTATKVALQSAQPLVIAVCRFAMAAVLMLFISHVFLKNKLPKGKQWQQLAIYGVLNISIYLGLYIIAMKEVTASIGALTVAASPVFISFLSFLFLKKPLSSRIVFALFICVSGFIVVAWPLLGTALVTKKGLVLLISSMLSYAIGTIYFSSKKWDGLHLLTINGWQTCLGGLFLLPFTLLTFKSSKNHFDIHFWWGTLWLALPVSIVAVLLWLKLIRQDAVKAGFWLFLCPVFGIIIAALLVGDAVNIFTITGVALVLAGLALSHYNNKMTTPME